MNLAAFADDRLAFDMHVGVNHAIAPNLRFATDVRMRRIDGSYALIKHQAPNRAATQKVFELCKFRARIDAGELASVVVLIDTNFLYLVSQDLRDIRQVVFALLVNSFNSPKRRKKFPAFKAVNSRVDFT